jgi:hypothetical protein
MEKKSGEEVKKKQRNRCGRKGIPSYSRNRSLNHSSRVAKLDLGVLQDFIIQRKALYRV